MLRCTQNPAVFKWSSHGGTSMSSKDTPQTPQTPPHPLTWKDVSMVEVALTTDNETVRDAWERFKIVCELSHGEALPRMVEARVHGR